MSCCETQRVLKMIHGKENWRCCLWTSVQIVCFFMSFKSFVEIIPFTRHLLCQTKTVNEVVKALAFLHFLVRSRISAGIGNLKLSRVQAGCKRQTACWILLHFNFHFGMICRGTATDLVQKLYVWSLTFNEETPNSKPLWTLLVLKCKYS